MLGRGRGGRAGADRGEGRAEGASSPKFRLLIPAEDSTAESGLSSPRCDFLSAPVLHVPLRKLGARPDPPDDVGGWCLGAGTRRAGADRGEGKGYLFQKISITHPG